MFCESRAPRRAVAVLFVVPIVLGAACASKSDADLFDSTPKPFAGRPSAGGAQSSGATGGSADSLATGGKPATGGAPSVPVRAQGGSAGAEPAEPSGGEPGDPVGMGGAADATGGVTDGAGGKPTATTGGKPASGGAGGNSAGASTGGTASGGTTTETGGAATGGVPACEPEPELCDGVDNDCDSEVDEDACSSGCEGFTLEGSRYMLCKGDHGDTAAHEACRDAGMHLAWIETQEENHALAEKLGVLMDVEPGSDGGNHQAQVRIGATDSDEEGVWRWEAPGEGAAFWEHEHGGMVYEGTVADGYFANWAEKRPNGTSGADEDCLVIDVQNGDDGEVGQWNDIFCSGEYPFVCEH